MTMWRTRPAAGCVLAAMVASALMVASCGSTGGKTAEDVPSTASTELPSGNSGAFAVDPVPDGFSIDRAYTDTATDRKSIEYLQHGDDDLPSFTIAAWSWPDDQPPFADLVQNATVPGSTDQPAKAEVRGHSAYIAPMTDEGREYGSSVIWEERPGYVVELSVMDGTGIDPVELANDTYEISAEAFESVRLGTNAGSAPGAHVTAVTGTVDGDPYVLTAILPERYPVEPVDHRGGCAELTFRGETASTCASNALLAFAPIDAARQAMLGGVDFGFGVFRDGTGDVRIAPVETPEGPWEQANAAVVPEAPHLTWFVLSFPRVCDRVALSKSATTQSVGVPTGYPHSKCD